MGKKHRRERVGAGMPILALEVAVRARTGPEVPRHVIANFDRWIDATAAGEAERARGLLQVLRRAGYDARRIYGVGGHDVYRLRRR